MDKDHAGELEAGFYHGPRGFLIEPYFIFKEGKEVHYISPRNPLEPQELTTELLRTLRPYRRALEEIGELQRDIDTKQNRLEFLKEGYKRLE